MSKEKLQMPDGCICPSCGKYKPRKEQWKLTESICVKCWNTQQKAVAHDVYGMIGNKPKARKPKEI